MEKGKITFTVRTDAEYAAAIKDSHGILSVAARKLGLARNTVQGRIKRNPELKALLDSERDVFIDECEERLYNCVVKESFPAIQYALKTVGAARGWGENQTIKLKTNFEFENDYDLSVLTEEEKSELIRLTAKIYQPKLIEEENC